MKTSQNSPENWFEVRRVDSCPVFRVWGCKIDGFEVRGSFLDFDDN